MVKVEDMEQKDNETEEGFLNFSNFDSGISIVEEEKGEQGVLNQQIELQKAVSFIKDKFNEAKSHRRTDERRWLTCYKNYRGVYDNETRFTDKEKSQIFVKITKTKVHAAQAQLTEILLAGGKFPIGVQPIRTPSSIVDKISVKKKEGGPEEPNSKIIRKDILEKTGVFSKKLEAVKDSLQEGTTGDPNEIVYEPNKVAADKMDMKIQDQLAEANAAKHLRNFTFEQALFGHGVFKGPLGKTKEYPRWTKKGEYEPRTEYIPDISFVSIWDFYPDPDARHDGEAEHIIQRHRFSRMQMRELKTQKYFFPETIDNIISNGPNYTPEYWEHQIEDSNQDRPDERFEVLEFWGFMDKELVDELDIKIPENLEDQPSFQVNVWLSGEKVIRAVLNPFKPNNIPYHSAPYELNPYSFFGIGVAENMEDTQLIMNGFMRLMIDNAVLSSNLIFEVDEANLSPGQSLDVHPGKVFKRMAGAPGQALFSTKFQNTTNESMVVFDKARQLADEATGMPSYSHGMTGVTGVGRTASGMSMLMGAAAQNIKSVVRNIDDYLLIPLGKSLIAFNMQFNFDEEMIGEIEAVANGTESLMRNEVRSQKILQFLQLTANPLDAPFTKRDNLLRELAKSLDLDAEMTVNDMREAKLEAIKMAGIQGPMQQAGMPPAGPPQGGQGPNPSGAPSPAGAETGNVGPAIPQDPNSESFSAPQENMGGMSGQPS